MRRFLHMAGLCIVLASSSPLVAPAGELRFDKQAVSLDVLERGRTTARWYSGLETSDGPLRFGELVVLDDNGGVDTHRPTVPLIGRMRGVSDAALEVRDPEGRTLGWQFVAGGPSEREVWGVLDALYTEPNPSLTLVHSTDGGATWATQQLKKPAPEAEFVAMTMRSDGSGAITLYLPQGQGGLQPGYYPFATADAGKTWSADKPQTTDLRPREVDPGDLRTPVQPQRVRAEYFGGSGWVYCYRPICRPYGWVPPRPPGGWTDDTVTPRVEDKGRLKALENPGFDDRMEKGKVPARFDITPKERAAR